MSPSAAATGKQALAAAWALNQIGSRDYYNLCQRFVEQAYGTGGQYRSAGAAGNALNWGTDPDAADVGDLVFFRPDASNGGAGHVGIYLGNGEMVSATNGGITRDNFLNNGYWKNLFVGFGDPPDQWKGQPATNDLVAGAASLAGRAKIAVGNAIGGRQVASAAYWGAAAPYAQDIMSAATKYDVPANVLAGLLIQESGGKVDARSSAGALGLMQFMPGTARGMGIDPLDPSQAIDGGARYLKQLADQSGGDWELAVGKYNAGPAGNLNNAETRNHMVKVMQYADTIGQGMGAGGSAGGGLPPSGGGRGDEDMDTYRPARSRTGMDVRGMPSGPTMDDVIQALIQAQSATGQAKDAALAKAGQMLGQLQSGAGQRNPPPGSYGAGALQSGQQARSGVGNLLDAIGQVGGQSAAPGQPPAGGGSLADILGRQPARPAPTGPPPPGGGSLADILGRAGRGAPGATSAGPGGPPPPGGGDLIDPNTGQPINRSPQATPGQPGEIMGPPGRPPAAEKRKPNGWIDPSAYTGINRSTVETANGLLQQIQDANDELSGLTGTDAKSMLRREELQKAVNDAQGRMVSLTPSLQKIEAEEQGGREGILAPGATPYMKKVPIYKKVDGKWVVEYIDNAGAEEDPANVRAGMQEAGANARNAADIASRQAISGAELGVRREEMGSREDIASMQEEGATSRTNINATTQRVTTALAQAVEQRRQDIDGQIRKGDLDLRTATEQFNQWYKQNVEAPLAILNTKRETERLRVEQTNAVTTRATAQSAHERGVANIGQQMWASASDAYNKMIPNTVGAGWGEGFQKNLQGQGYQPNQGATFNTPESLDAFATRKTAEMLKGISPFADSILGAEGQVGAPGPGMSGQDMTALTNQAAGVASNALSNPFQMPQQTPFTMPGQIDVAGLAGAGMQGGGGLTNEIDQYLPQLPNYGGV